MLCEADVLYCRGQVERTDLSISTQQWTELQKTRNMWIKGDTQDSQLRQEAKHREQRREKREVATNTARCVRGY